MNKFIALAAAALLTLAGCNQSANWDQFQNAFIERAFEIDPHSAPARAVTNSMAVSRIGAKGASLAPRHSCAIRSRKLKP